ncbi:MAG: response regulator [Elusimicrobiota bacterium]|jgi:DNA-binding response OmpR family regulator
MKTILVVDDDMEIVDFLSECLRAGGYEVFTAYDGIKGVAQARAHRPDLIVLDLMMPGMHGFEVCQVLRADEQFKGVKILISSAKSYPVDRKAALQAGADGYLTKPYTADELFLAVKKLLEP